MFPTFCRFLLLGLLTGMIRCHDPTADTLVPEQLWQTIQPFLPPPPRRYGSRPASTTALPWAGSSTSCAPASPSGCYRSTSSAAPAPSPCWRRLRDWQRAGVWQQLHHALLDELGRNSRLDWSRASLDSLSLRAKRGAA